MAVGDKATQDQLNSTNKNTKGRPPSPSMDDWESGGAGTLAVKVPTLASSKWEGEDEETEVLDSWDAEPEEVEEKPPQQPVIEEKKKEKKKSAKKIAERYEERMRARQQEEEEEEVKELTPEEAAAEKLRRRKLEEEADLELAKEIFGSSGGAPVLETKEDFDRFKTEILEKLESSGASKSAHFPDFAEELVRDLCVTLPSIDLRRLHTRLGNLQIEKAKMEKGDKSKKSAKAKSKAKLKLDGEMDVADYSSLVDDFDDYI